MWEKQITYDFSMEQFIDFMMIPSNVNSKIENGKITEVEAREWFEKMFCLKMSEYCTQKQADFDV